MSTTDDDIQAIRMCQQGDINGLEPLVARYFVQAQRIAFLLTGDRALAEDIAQDSFLQAFKSMGRFRAGSPFAPWFYRIVTNIARQRQRTAARSPAVSMHQLTRLEADDDSAPIDLSRHTRSSFADPSEQAERAEQRDALAAALRELSDAQREAVVLRYLSGYSDDEIASILGIRPGTARQRLTDGLRALDRIIRASYPDLLSESNSQPPAFSKEEVKHVS